MSAGVLWCNRCMHVEDSPCYITAQCCRCAVDPGIVLLSLRMLKYILGAGTHLGNWGAGQKQAALSQFMCQGFLPRFMTLSVAGGTLYSSLIRECTIPTLRGDMQRTYPNGPCQV